MKHHHNPLINLRYWVLINLISIFGTNTGDLMVRFFRQAFADQPWAAGLKHLGPFPFLLILFLVVYFHEQFSKRPQELHFWILILIIRTAATNVADALTDELSLSLSAVVMLLGIPFAAYALYWQRQRLKPVSLPFLAQTSWGYWGAMMAAGVMGTALGDALWQMLGLGPAALILTLISVMLVATGYRSYLALSACYWLGVLWARIAGTATGDWLAKSAAKGGAGLTLDYATLASGILFVVVALAWKSSRNRQVQPA
jgi:uncharacterized membrane-anchored protein